jgi:ribosomal protein S27AE
MAHSPEHPHRYVCTSCQVVHAGTVAEHTDSGGHTYEPPAACGACGATSFVREVDWPHRHD